MERKRRKNKGKVKQQKHKNRRAFAVRDKVEHEKMKKKVRLNNLCEKCLEIIQWKIKYGKYKKMTVPKKCIKCNIKRIVANYRVICDPCSDKLKLCSKCGHDKEFVIKGNFWIFTLK